MSNALAPDSPDVSWEPNRAMILVAGGAGYVGSALVPGLLALSETRLYEHPLWEFPGYNSTYISVFRDWMTDAPFQSEGSIDQVSSYHVTPLLALDRKEKS